MKRKPPIPPKPAPKPLTDAEQRRLDEQLKK